MRYLTRFMLLLLLLGSGCREAIVHDLDELRANRLQLLLLRSQIDAEKVRTGQSWSITVAPEALQRALAIIERSRILRPSGDRAATQDSGLFQTTHERTQLLEQLLAGRVEQTIEQIPGVLEARVHFHRADDIERSVSPAKQASSASVLVVAEHSAALDEGAVKALVAGAAGFKIDEISVLCSSVEEGSGRKEADPPSAPAYGLSALSHSSTVTVGIASIAAVILLLLSVKLRRRRRIRSAASPLPLPEEEDDSFEADAQERYRNIFPISTGEPSFHRGQG